MNKKTKELVKNIIDQHIVGKDNLTRYNLGLFNKISAKLNEKVDESLLSVEPTANSIPVRDENGQLLGVRPTADSHLTTKEYVDEQIITPGFVTKEYVDKRDEAIYQNSQKYTDQEIASQKQYIDSQDESNLKEAKEFADMKSIEAVQQAEGYTDTQITNLDAKKVDKLKQANKVYATNGAGADTSRDMSSTATPNSIPIRNGQGNFKVNTPQEEQDVANKKYVDDQIIEGHGKVEVGRWVILGEAVKDLDPIEIFGYGIWSDVAEKYGEGALRVALNNYDYIGSDTITQTIAQMPSHNHYSRAFPEGITAGYTTIPDNLPWDYVSESNIVAHSYTGGGQPMSSIQKSLNIRVLEREE